MHTRIEDLTPGSRVGVARKGRTLYVVVMRGEKAGILLWVRFDNHNLVRMRRSATTSERGYFNWKISVDAESLMTKMKRAGRPLRVCVHELDASEVDVVIATDK